jgi:hypothetical protein
MSPVNAHVTIFIQLKVRLQQQSDAASPSPHQTD